MNKKDKPLVPLSGGLVVLGGFLAGITTFIFFRTFFAVNGSIILDDTALKFLFAGIISIIIVCLVGFVDDLVVQNPQQSSGLRQWQKPLLTLFAAVPLMVVAAGETTMIVPFIGHVNFGIFYPLLFIPLGFLGASNMVNMLAGFNGLETGMGIIYLSVLGLYAYVHERYIAALLALVVVAALIGFYFYNKYPAQILPGDSLTYFLGATLATIAILGDLEKAALIVSIPFFIEFILKARSKFAACSYGKYVDGTIHSFSKGIYSIPHFFTCTGKFTEKEIVYYIFFIVFLISNLIWVI